MEILTVAYGNLGVTRGQYKSLFCKNSECHSRNVCKTGSGNTETKYSFGFRNGASVGSNFQFLSLWGDKGSWPINSSLLETQDSAEGLTVVLSLCREYCTSARKSVSRNGSMLSKRRTPFHQPQQGGRWHGNGWATQVQPSMLKWIQKSYPKLWGHCPGSNTSRFKDWSQERSTQLLESRVGGRRSKVGYSRQNADQRDNKLLTFKLRRLALFMRDRVWLHPDIKASLGICEKHVRARTRRFAFYEYRKSRVCVRSEICCAEITGLINKSPEHSLESPKQSVMVVNGITSTPPQPFKIIYGCKAMQIASHVHSTKPERYQKRREALRWMLKSRIY